MAGEDGRRQAPAYSSASIVNAASSTVGPVAPGSIVSLYGTGLALAERAITVEDMRGGILPTVLPGAGTRVLINSIGASLYYAGPKQINFLIPSNIIGAEARVEVVMNGQSGPVIRIPLAEAAPAFFQLDAKTVIGQHADGALLSPESPARTEEVIVLYATGLGVTSPPAIPGQIVTLAAKVARPGDFEVLLDGEPVERSRLEYIGATPGFAGLYQINLRLPPTGQDPEIQVRHGDRISPAGLRIIVRSE